MNTLLLRSMAFACAVVALASCQSNRAGADPGDAPNPMPDNTPKTIPTSMDLGAFSLSLAVKDLAASRAFYEKLGFEQVGGDPTQNWIILRNATTVIGLFQGMFEDNMLTFNPGWAASMDHPEEFTDIRELEQRVRAAGIEPHAPIQDEARSGSGPASFVLMDPDGNPVLIDQHR